MKPCLVHRTSTSDEELANHLLASRLNEQPTHGILKVPSGKKIFIFTKNSIFRANAARAFAGAAPAGAGGGVVSKFTVGALCAWAVAENSTIGLELEYIDLAQNTCGKVRSVVLKSWTDWL